MYLQISENDWNIPSIYNCLLVADKYVYMSLDFICNSFDGIHIVEH